MNRKVFIKNVTGGKAGLGSFIQSILFLVIIVLLIKSDRPTIPSSFFSYLKLFGILLLIIAGLFVLAFAFNKVQAILLKIIPSKLMRWFATHQQSIQLIFITVILLYLGYTGYKENEYKYLIITGIYLLCLAYFRWQERKREKN